MLRRCINRWESFFCPFVRVYTVFMVAGAFSGYSGAQICSCLRPCFIIAARGSAPLGQQAVYLAFNFSRVGKKQ